MREPATCPPVGGRVGAAWAADCGCVPRLCAQAVCPGCVPRLCAQAVCPGCVPRLCAQAVCPGCRMPTGGRCGCIRYAKAATWVLHCGGWVGGWVQCRRALLALCLDSRLCRDGGAKLELPGAAHTALHRCVRKRWLEQCAVLTPTCWHPVPSAPACPRRNLQQLDHADTVSMTPPRSHGLQKCIHHTCSSAVLPAVQSLT